jgi:hypothetical protein
MRWSSAHTMVLILGPLAIFGFWYFRRWEDDPKSPYTVMIRRYRIAMLIGGIGGILALIRFWISYR